MTLARPDRTASFLRGLRRPGGGYTAQAGDGEPRLQSTVSALKALALLRADPEAPEATRAFVHSCRDPASGGFSDRPGGPPGVFATALGLIALRTLEDAGALEAAQGPALRFLAERSASEADHFMAIAAHEECRLRPPFPPAAVAFFQGSQRDDALFGAGGPRASAIAAGALLRAAQTLSRPEVVAACLRAAQRPDGGFAEDGGPSDLTLSYMVMRALTLLRAAPDLARLRSYLEILTGSEGGYAGAAGSPATADATYHALSILDWSDALAAGASAGSPEPTGPGDLRAAVALARRGDVPALASWLEAGGDPDRTDEEGWTPLLAAASRGQASVIAHLLFHDLPGARRASPDVPFASARALPIYMAGQNGDLQSARLLLRARPQHLHERAGVNGHTLLLQAAFFGFDRHHALARYLLENVGEILGLPAGDAAAVAAARRRLLVATNVRGLNALAMARMWKNQRMVDLFEAHPDPPAAEQKAYRDELLAALAPRPPGTPAQELSDGIIDAIEKGYAASAETPAGGAGAIAEGAFAAVRAIAETPGFEINRLGGRLQQPPLVVAVSGQDRNEAVAALRLRLVRYLLERGADPDLPEHHPMAVDAVIRAAVLNHFEALQLIGQSMPPAQLRAAMNLKPAVNGLTALHDSVHRALSADARTLPRNLAQIRWMVERGARPDIEDHTGKTQEGMARAALQDPLLRENAAAVLQALAAARPS